LSWIHFHFTPRTHPPLSVQSSVAGLQLCKSATTKGRKKKKFSRKKHCEGEAMDEKDDEKGANLEAVLKESVDLVRFLVLSYFVGFFVRVLDPLWYVDVY
jgi:uncharacterized protein YqhQ